MKRNKFIVIGSGRLGSNIASFMSEKGRDVIIIDESESSFRKLKESYSGYEIVGDATNLEVLENAHIKEAETVLLSTNSDNINIFLAHVCYYIYHIPNIYVRLEDTDKGLLLDNTNIKAIYPADLSFQNFLEEEAKK